MKKIFSGCLLFSVFFSLFSQEKDAGLWTEIAVEKKITQSFSAYINQSLRFHENVSEPGGFFTEAGLEKKILKDIGFSLNYRYYHKKDKDGSYAPRHRYFIDISYKKKLGRRIAVSYRIRLQSQVKNYFIPSELYGNSPENYWRNKLSLRYMPVKKIRPFIAAEIWHPLNNPKRKPVDNLRFSGGLQHDLNKRNAIEICFITQRELQQKNPLTEFIIALNYTFAF